MALRLLGCLLSLTLQGEPLAALSSGQESRDSHSAVNFRLGAGCGEKYAEVIMVGGGQIITVQI